MSSLASRNHTFSSIHFPPPFHLPSPCPRRVPDLTAIINGRVSLCVSLESKQLYKTAGHVLDDLFRHTPRTSDSLQHNHLQEFGERLSLGGTDIDRTSIFPRCPLDAISFPLDVLSTKYPFCFSAVSYSLINPNFFYFSHFFSSFFFFLSFLFSLLLLLAFVIISLFIYFRVFPLRTSS